MAIHLFSLTFDPDL